MNRGIVFEFVKQSPQGKIRFQEKWNLPSKVLLCLGTGLVNTWEEAELKIFITYALIYVSVQVSCFCLGWKCYVIRRVCLSGRYFLVGSLKHLLLFIFFIFLQLSMCSAGGRSRFFPQSVQNCSENRVSTVRVPHLGVSPPTRSFGRECHWRNAGFGSLKSCVSSQICTGRGYEVHTCLMDCFRLFRYWIWIELVIKHVDMHIYLADQRYIKPESSAAATNMVRQIVIFVLFLESSAKLFGKKITEVVVAQKKTQAQKRAVLRAWVRAQGKQAACKRCRNGFKKQKSSWNMFSLVSGLSLQLLLLQPGMQQFPCSAPWGLGIARSVKTNNSSVLRKRMKHELNGANTS